MAHPIKVQPGLEPPPGSVRWMQLPHDVGDCPKGLEYLSLIDEFYIKQEVNLLEAFTKWEEKNSYTVLNKHNEKIFQVAEESNMCFRNCCENKRAYKMHILDNFENEIIRISRPYKCCAGDSTCMACLPCCAQESKIESPPGTVIGYVQQRCACCSSAFSISDASGTDILTIDGPCSCCLECCPCCGKVFRITTVQGSNEIGSVIRKWNGFAANYYTNADLFGVKVPLDLDVKMKAVLMGAVFLIDFMEFEKKSNKDKDKEKELKEKGKVNKD